MKKLYLLFLMSFIALLGFGQKYYSESDMRFYDLNEDVVNKSTTISQEKNTLSEITSSGDTVWAGVQNSPYTANATRGYFFQAQSTFNIVAVMCAEEGNPSATMQSFEIVSFGSSVPIAYPGPGSPHTVLFSALNVASGWVDCNVELVQGNYYGIIGAKHDLGGSTMYNSYGSPQNLVIDGISTYCARLVLQSPLSAGSPASGMYMTDVGGPIGRVHFVTGSNCIEDITQDNDPGECGAIITYTQPSAWDTATVAQIDGSGLSSGDLFPVDTTIQSYRIDYGGGDVDTCMFTVIVKDVEAPVITCGNDTTLIAEPGETGVVVNYTPPVVVDQCSGPGNMDILFVSDNAGATEIPATLTAAGYNVTSVYNDYSAGNNATLQGDLSMYSVIFWNASGSGSGDSHNASTFTNLSNYVNSGGNVYVTGYDVIASPTDINMITFLGGTSSFDGGYNTDSTLVASSLTTGYSDIVGLNVTNIYQDHDGLVGPYAAGLTVVLPTYSGGALWSVRPLGSGEIAWVASGQYSTEPMSAWGTPGSRYHESLLNFAYNSNGRATLTAGLPSGSEFPVGTTTNTFEVTDGAGNVSTCSFDVTVVSDATPPVVSCRPLKVYLDRSGAYTLTGEDIDYIATGTTDDVTAFEDLDIQVTPNAFDCDSVGEVNVLVTAMDEAGNIDSCETVVTVINKFEISPFPVSDITVELPEGVCETKVEYPYIGSFTPCVTFTQLEGLGPAGHFPAGATTEVWQAVNTSGDTMLISFTVTVVSEGTEPTLAAIADVETDENTPVSVTLSGIGNGGGCDMDSVLLTVSGYDNALFAEVTLNYSNGDTTGTIDFIPNENQFGTSGITVEVTDGEGLATMQSFTVTVMPVNDAPVLVQPLPDVTLIAKDTVEIDISKQLGTMFDDIDDSTLTITIDFNGDTLPSWIAVSEDQDLYSLEVTPLQADTGCYSIIVTATDLAGAMVADTFELCVDKLVGIPNISDQLFDIRMYPNPTNAKVNIDMISTAGNVEVMVMNIAGAEVYRKVFKQSEAIRFDLSDNVSGMYLVRVKTGDKQVIKKLILDRK